MAVLNVSRSFVSSMLAFFSIVLGFFVLLFTTSSHLTFSSGESDVGTAYADAPASDCSSCSGDGYTSCGPCGDSCDAGCGCY